MPQETSTIRSTSRATPEQRYKQAAGGVLAGGIILTAFGIGAAIYLWVLPGQVVWDAVLLCLAWAAFGVLMIPAGIGLWRRQSWARKWTVVLCFIGMLALAAWLVSMIAFVPGAVQRIDQDRKVMEYLAKERPDLEADSLAARRDSAKVIAMLVGMTILAVAVFAWMIWRIWLVSRYFRSDEVKQICRHAGS